LRLAFARAIEHGPPCLAFGLKIVDPIAKRLWTHKTPTSDEKRLQVAGFDGVIYNSLNRPGFRGGPVV
jgi:hypothetical protein